MPDNTQQGETEEEYYERIKNVPGLFNDRNETAKETVEKADTNLKEAQLLEKLTPLAPSTAAVETDDEDEDDSNEESETKDESKDDSKKADKKTEDKASSKKDAKDSKAKNAKDEDATGPSGDYAEQLPAEDQAGQPPRA